MHELMDRFSFGDDASSSRRLTIEEPDLLRSGFHRALADRDVRSLDLTSCWLDFLKQCPDVNCAEQDSRYGQTLLHAVVQNHRSEALLDLVEEYYEDLGTSLEEDTVNLRDDQGYTALALAAQCSTSAPCCLRLLELKSDIS